MIKKEKSGNIQVEEPEDKFKRVHIGIINNPNIDCLTLGIYVKILTLGKTWSLNIKGLSTIFGLSDTKVRKSISTLEKEGYVSRFAVKAEGGKFVGWDYIIHYEPTDDSDRTNAGKRTCQKTDTPQNGHDRKRTTPLTDMTENREEHINILNQTIDLNNKEKEINKENIDKRRQIFLNDLGLRFSVIYPGDMLDRFADYWTEPNKSGTKMRFEMEKTWDLGRRLKRWSDNDNKFRNGQANNSTSNDKQQRMQGYAKTLNDMLTEVERNRANGKFGQGSDDDKLCW